MTKVFVSYKSEDRARVRPLVDALIAEDLAVWWDVAIEGGAVWREAITTRLDAAACVVVVWSTASVGPGGRFVHDEAARADRRGVYLPVGIDPVEPPLGFGQHQVLPLTGWRGDARDPRFADVVAAIRAMVAGAPAPVPRGISPTVAPGRGWPLVAGGIALAAAVAVGVAVVPHSALCLPGMSCPAAAPRNSIAVLPFANLSADASQAYFADGLSEELLGALAGIDTLQVAARTSSFKFKDSKDTSRDIGAKLGVAYILDGSVRRSGDQVRVDAQLVDAASGFQRWSATYDRDLKDVFAVQRGIAGAVATALKVKLGDRAVASLARAGSGSAAANDAYLRGRAILSSNTNEAGLRQALGLFDAALAADPDFADAHAERARALLGLANNYVFDPASQRLAYGNALAAARRAVALAPASAEAQSSLAGALLYGEIDVAGARRAFDRSLATGAGNADILLRYGLFACRTNQMGPGLAAIQQAVVLDPLYPRAFKTLGLALITARSYPEAITALRKALALGPATNGVHAAIGDALLLQGKVADAVREYAAEPAGWQHDRGMAIGFARQGNRAASDTALAALIANSGDAGLYQQAQVHAQRGEPALALAALDRAFAARDSGVLQMLNDPLLDPVRGAPGFAGLLVRLHVGG